jgi:hypothetical protein
MNIKTVEEKDIDISQFTELRSILKKDCKLPKLWVLRNVPGKQKRQGFCFEPIVIDTQIKSGKDEVKSGKQEVKSVKEDEEDEEKDEKEDKEDKQDKQDKEENEENENSEEAMIKKKLKNVYPFISEYDYRIELGDMLNKFTSLNSGLINMCIKYSNEFQNINIPNRRSGLWALKTGERIGVESVFGKVYKVCSAGTKSEYENTKKYQISDDCGYVVKLIPINKYSSSNTYSNIINEINMQIKFSNHNLGPKIIDAFYCTKYHIDPNSTQRLALLEKITDAKGEIKQGNLLTKIACIVMEIMDISVREFLNFFPKYSSLKEYYFGKAKEYARELILKANKLGLIHGDPHDGNFMFNLNSKAKEFINSYVVNNKINKEGLEILNKNKFNFGLDTMKMIDFGYSEELSEEQKKRKGKIFELDDLDFKFSIN